jgi:hypothetical protein
MPGGIECDSPAKLDVGPSIPTDAPMRSSSDPDGTCLELMETPGL